MAVGMPRIPNPYGPPPFYGPDGDMLPPPAMQPQVPPQSPFIGFQDVAGAFGQGAETAADGVQLIQPIEKPDAPPGVGGPPEGEQGDYPSEASIESRMRLAKALMGERQEVNHPMQAIGNAVSQITGAYLERKAGRDQESIEKRRREAYKNALGGGSTADLNALADRLIASSDPELVDKGLQIKMQIAMGQGKSGGRPDIQEFVDGDQVVQKQWNPETRTWDEVGRGPRFSRQVPGAGGDGNGNGSGGRRQQGGTFQLPSGDVVAANFNPNDGQYYFQDANGRMVPVPPNSRPVNPSTGGTLNANQWKRLKQDRVEGINGLKAIEKYAAQAGGLPQGYKRWANDWAAKIKTFLGNQNLTPDQFDQLEAGMRQQALLGMLRTTIVGPGVMTEADAQRIIEALGGKVSSALQNPEVLVSILADIYERKRREVQVLQEEYERNFPSFNGPDEKPEPLGVPDTIRPEQQQRSGAGSTPLPQGVPPKDKRPKGTRVTKGGKTFEWTGTGWREVQ